MIVAAVLVNWRQRLGFKPYSESKGDVSDTLFNRNMGTHAEGSLLKSEN